MPHYPTGIPVPDDFPMMISHEDIELDRETRLADRLADEEALKAWAEAGGL